MIILDREARRVKAIGSPAPLEPLLSLDDLAALLRIGRRTLERMRSMGQVPPPDLHIGKMPRWKPETIRQWIENGGGA